MITKWKTRKQSVECMADGTWWASKFKTSKRIFFYQHNTHCSIRYTVLYESCSTTIKLHLITFSETLKLQYAVYVSAVSKESHQIFLVIGLSVSSRQTVGQHQNSVVVSSKL